MTGSSDFPAQGASMKISSDLFTAFLKCSTKRWLRAGGEPASGNTYADG